MPGFWDYLSQAAERYNQVRSDLEREQADLMNMYGNQLNNLYANTMSGLSLSSGLLGQKLGSLLNLYGTQTTAEEGAKNRASNYDIARLNAQNDLAVALAQIEGSKDIEALRAANDLQQACYEAQINKELGLYGYPPDAYINSAEATPNYNAGKGNKLSPFNTGGSVPADKLAVANVYSPIGSGGSSGKGGYSGQIPQTPPAITKDDLKKIDKLVSKYKVDGNTLWVTDPEDFNVLNYYYKRGALSFRPIDAARANKYYLNYKHNW